MSWGVYGIGKAPAVKKEIERQGAALGKCDEPEETIKQAALTLLGVTLAGQADKTVVKITASGSMSYNYNEKKVTSNSVNIVVEVINNFVE